MLTKALMENYRIWANKKTAEDLTESSVLFDTVAIYLAYPGTRNLVTMEELTIGVTNDGLTRVDSAGAKMLVATEWKDLEGYRNMLVKTLAK